MTTETRSFIDLADFVAIRFVCRNCGEKTPVRLLADSKFLSYRDGGFTCPHCGTHWFEGHNDKRLDALTVFLDRFQQLQTAKLAFGLEFEVRI
jgi:hypothetical protein